MLVNSMDGELLLIATVAHKEAALADGADGPQARARTRSTGSVLDCSFGEADEVCSLSHLSAAAHELPSSVCIDCMLMKPCSKRSLRDRNRLVLQAHHTPPHST